MVLTKKMIIIIDSKIIQNKPTLNELGTRYNPNEYAKLLGFLAIYKFLRSRLLNFLIDPTGMGLHQKIENPLSDEKFIRYIFKRFSKLNASNFFLL